MPSEHDPFFRFTSIAMEKKTYLNMIYLLLMLPLGVIYFTIVITGFSLAMSLLILIIGVFIALGFLLLIRGISTLHLSLASSLLGFELPPRQQTEVTGEGLFDKMKTVLTDGKTYTTMIYMFIELPLGILYFTLIITLLSISISFVASPILLYFFGDNHIFVNSNEWMWKLDFEERILLMVGGVFLFFVTLHMSNMFAKVEEVLCKNLLVRL